MYQALYRKYRPRSFSDVTGQEHVTETLRRQIITGRLSHAYLFVGTRGTGKTTCAKILSRAVNCRAPVNGDPCNACPSCTGIENGSILDVLELDAASNNGVDNVRTLREEAIYTPAAVNKRVYIVDEVHMLTSAAFNALLKILEEPPEHLLFILATTELHKVPATILSRCQRFSFKRLSPATIEARLDAVARKEGLTLTKDAAEKLAALADGSMRDGISLLDQCAAETTVDLARVLDVVGLAGQRELSRLAEAIVNRDTAAALGILDSLYSDGKDIAALLSELSALARDLLIYKLSPDTPLLSGGLSREELSALSGRLTPERLFSFLDVLRDTVFSVSRSGSARLSAEMCLIRLCDERLNDDTPALLARLARLENNSQFTIHNSQLTIQEQQSETNDSQFTVHDSQLMAQGFQSETLDSEPDRPESDSQVTNQEQSSEISDSQFAVQEQQSETNNSQATIHDSQLMAQGFQSGTLDSEPATQGNLSTTHDSKPKDNAPGPGGSAPEPKGSAPETEGCAPEPVDNAPGSEGSGFLAPDSESATPAPERDYWDDILEQLKNEASVLSMLSDRDKVRAELRDRILVIYAEDIFTIGSIESGVLSGPLGEAASKVLGYEVVIRAEISGKNEELQKTDRIWELKKYNNVKFE